MARYSRDWTTKLAENVDRYVRPLLQHPIAWLEIGVFEGQTAKWLLDNLLTEREDFYAGIDPWELEAMAPSRWPRDGRGEEAIRAVEERAFETLRPYMHQRAILCKGQSSHVLRSQTEWIGSAFGCFSVVYIDGLHTPLGVLSDAVLCWPLLKIGGLMIFDDYRCRLRTNTRRVRQGVHAFLDCVGQAGQVVFRNHQLGLRKLADGYQETWACTTTPS